MSETCPVCGGDPCANLTEIRKLIQEHGFTGEMTDPGGRVLYFGARSLRVSDMCNSCDAATIRKFLEGGSSDR